MDYENNYTYTNIRIVLITLFIIIGFNYYIHPIDYLVKDTVVNITPTPTPITIYKNVVITVTPTIDGKTYFAGEYQSGIRKLGRYFSWLNKNVLGNNEMSGHVKVYDYMLFDTIHYYEPADAKYYELHADTGKKFLFIFVKTYLDNIVGDAVPMWLPDEQHFIVQDNNVIYHPIVWDERLRIRELENTVNDNGDHRIEYYGQYNTYSRDLKYKDTAGEYAEQIYWVTAGESNAIDGYIIYSVDENIDINDVKILGNLFDFGKPIWSLTK